MKARLRDEGGSGLILVGVDGSVPALQALRVAVGLARLVHGSLVLIHVAVFPHPPTGSSVLSALQTEAAARSAGEEILAEATRRAGDVLRARELHFGRPADVICRRAEELGAHLVVVGSRGLGRLDRFLLGSVSSAVSAQAPCSALVVRPRKKGRRRTEEE